MQSLRNSFKNSAYLAACFVPFLVGCSSQFETASRSDSGSLPRLTSESLTVREGETAQLTFSLDQPSQGAKSYIWTTRGIEATSGADFTPQSGSLTFSGGTGSVTVSVPTVDDELYEENERLEIELTQSDNSGSGSGSGAGTMKVEALILDNDSPPSLSITDAIAVEGEEALLTVSLSEVSGRPTRVQYETVFGTAMSNDIRAVSGTLLIPAGSLSGQIAVPTEADGNVESNETFQVRLTSPLHATLADSTGDVVLFDGDGPTAVGFAQSARTVSESVGSVTVTVYVVGTTTAPVVVPYTVTGTAGASDHDLVDGTLNLAAGATSGTITFHVTNDALGETDETVVLTLGAPTGAALGATPAQTITITDDDPAPVLSVADLSVNEADGTATFTVSLANATDRDVTFDWTTADATAMAGVDYTASSGVGVTIPALSTSATLSVPITQDADVCEGDKTFQVVLSNVTEVDVADDTAVATLVDDEGVALSIADSAVVEGVTADFVVTVTPQCTRPIVFDWTTSNGSAVAGVNYAASSASAVTIPAHTSTVTLQVPTLSAGLSASKTFSVALSHVSSYVTVSDASATGTLATLSLDLNLTASLPAAVSFSRSSVATYFGSDKLLKVASADTPRFDHDPLTGAALGLLIEGASTNVALDSEDLSSGNWWSDGTLVVTPDTATAPTGTMLADRLDDTDLATSARRAFGFAAANDGETWTFSIFVKKDTSRYLGLDLEFLDGATPVQPSAVFDLDTGTSTTCGSVVAARAQNIGNGWFRVSITVANNASGNTTLIASLYPARHSGLTCVEDDTLTGSVFAWGAQLEKSEFPTSYIPTTSAGLERKADNARLLSTTWYSTVAGTYVVDAHLPFEGGDQALFLSAGSGADNIEVLKAAWGQLAFFVQAASATSMDEWNGENWLSGESKRVAVTGQADDFAFAVGGAITNTSRSGAWPAAPTQLQLGQQWGTQLLNGHLSALKYYPYRLSDRTLETITTP